MPISTTSKTMRNTMYWAVFASMVVVLLSPMVVMRVESTDPTLCSAFLECPSVNLACCDTSHCYYDTPLATFSSCGTGNLSCYILFNFIHFTFIRFVLHRPRLRCVFSLASALTLIRVLVLQGYVVGSVSFFSSFEWSSVSIERERVWFDRARDEVEFD